MYKRFTINSALVGMTEQREHIRRQLDGLGRLNGLQEPQGEYTWEHPTAWTGPSGMSLGIEIGEDHGTQTEWLVLTFRTENPPPAGG